MPHAGPTIRETAESYRSGSTTPVEVVQEALDRIERLNPTLNCFITVLRDSALEAARKSEGRMRSGELIGPLDGVPVAVKDLIYIEGVRCTAGSKILRDHVAAYDSPAVGRLKAAGAVIVGTTNLHEFGSGVTSDNPHYGPVRNPWDSTKVAGGSSGGSAACVAVGMGLGALGTDTGGSVRIPAALCGVVGLKPTYGRVSRLGVVPLAPSLDTVGCVARGSWDAAAMLGVISGGDKGDVTTVDSQVPDYLRELGEPLRGAKIGIPRRYFHDVMDPDVESSFEGLVGRLEEAGCRRVDMELEGAEEACRRWVPIRRAEATAFHLKWLEATPELYGEDVRRLLELGRDVSAVDYVSAVNSRPSLMEKFASSMAGVDVVATPTTCVTAPSVGQKDVLLPAGRVDVYAALNRLTLPFNLVGFPALTLPAGTVRGLPVGLQLVARPFEEARLLSVAFALESKLGVFPEAPPGMAS